MYLLEGKRVKITNGSVGNYILNRFQRDPLVVGPENLLWALCFPDSCTNEDIQLSVDRALTPAFQDRNISVDVVVPPLMYTSKNTTMKYSNAVLMI